MDDIITIIGALASLSGDTGDMYGSVMDSWVQ